MLKTLKGKVIAGVAAFVLVSGASVAFGASDAGAKLKDWFDTQFGGVTDSIEKDYEGYLVKEKEKLDKDLVKLIADGKTDINKSRAVVAGEALSTIEETASDHIDSIKDAQEDIENYMDSEFDLLKTNAEEKLSKTINSFKSNAKWEIPYQLGETGDKAVKFLEDQLNYTTKVALKDIEDAIKAAKAELLKQIRNKSDATFEEIIISIDSSVADTQTIISELTANVVIEQQDLIEKKANEMVEDAKNEMQDLVDGI